MAKQVQYRIKGGPGKFELMVALFDIPENGCSKTVLFEFALNREMESPLAGTWAIIHSVQAEDGSRESWNLEGHMTGSQRHGPVGPKFKAYYSTKHRSGTLFILED